MQIRPLRRPRDGQRSGIARPALSWPIPKAENFAAAAFEHVSENHRRAHVLVVKRRRFKAYSDRTACGGHSDRSQFDVVLRAVGWTSQRNLQQIRCCGSVPFAPTPLRERFTSSSRRLMPMSVRLGHGSTVSAEIWRITAVVSVAVAISFRSTVQLSHDHRVVNHLVFCLRILRRQHDACHVRVSCDVALSELSLVCTDRCCGDDLRALTSSCCRCASAVARVSIFSSTANGSTNGNS